jgi:alkylhydroperoxidase family enzyme
VRIGPPTAAGRYGTELDAAMHDFERAAVRIQGVDPITTELVRLRCARFHDCRRCQAVRDDAALEAGFDEELGAKIDDYERSDLSARHKAALRLTDAMILSRPIDPALRADVHAHFSEAEIAELLLDVVKWSVQKALVALRIEPPPNDGGLTSMAADAGGTYRFGAVLSA